jgi:hypothetical protein
MYELGDRVTNTFTGATGIVFGTYYSDGAQFYRVGYVDGCVENLVATELRHEPLSSASTSERDWIADSEDSGVDTGSAVMSWSCGCSDYHFADCPIRTASGDDWYPDPADWEPGWDQD